MRRSPHRFELVLKDPQVIGMRRTAQVLMGKALQSLGDSRDVKAALNSALAELSAENNTISLARIFILIVEICYTIICMYVCVFVNT